jgi:hypothetical protein
MKKRSAIRIANVLVDAVAIEKLEEGTRGDVGIVDKARDAHDRRWDNTNDYI